MDGVHSGAASIGRAPVPNDSPIMALYFVVFFVVGSFFFLNPCIGVLIDNCYRMRNGANGQGANLTPEQREWITMQKEMMASFETQLGRACVPAESSFRYRIWQFVEWEWFDNAVLVVIAGRTQQFMVRSGLRGRERCPVLLRQRAAGRGLAPGQLRVRQQRLPAGTHTHTSLGAVPGALHQDRPRGRVGRRGEAVVLEGSRRAGSGEPGDRRVPDAAAGHGVLPCRPAPREPDADHRREAGDPRLWAQDPANGQGAVRDHRSMCVAHLVHRDYSRSGRT